MRKIIAITISILVSHGIILAQDLLVTTAGDSIHCRITRIEKKYIHFTFMQGEELRQTLIPVEDVRYHRANYFNTAHIPLDAHETKVGSHTLQGRIAVGGGYRVAKIDPDLPSLAKEYLEELMTGFCFGGEVYYAKTGALGYGGMLSVFRASNEISSLSIKDDITILYAGPSVMGEIVQQSNYSVTAAVSLGYLKYHNEALADGVDFNIDSGTLGLVYNLGLDFDLGENYGISLGVNYLRGLLTEITVTANGESETVELDKDSYESLNRLDFNIGFQFVLD